MLVCLKPLSQYKKKELYKHVETFELVDSKLFEDAVITENLCICTLKKHKVDIYDTYNKLFVSAICNCPINLFYKWNIDHNANLAMCRKDYKPVEFFNQNLDFIESGRCIAYIKGAGYFTKGTCAYNWNTFGNYNKFNWIHDIGVIHFNTKQAKDNFCKYAYNWTNNKWDCLASKALIYTKCIHVSSEYYFAIPQIDWSNIHINQKELWDKGLYDDAVLNEMGLKWNADKTVIIKDE